MVAQLRIYTIAEGKMDLFVDAWQKGVYPLRLKHGFTIECVWRSDEQNRFVWVLNYDGPEGFEARDAAYHASTERRTLDPDPAQYVAHIEKSFAVDARPAR